MMPPIAHPAAPGNVLADGKFTDLSDFGHDVWWLVLAKAILVFAFLVLTVLAAILIERKIMAYMQNRVGPNRWGPWGSLQSLADGIKLALKEGIVPAMVDRPVYFLAPIISVVPAIMAFAVVPFGPSVSVFGHRTALQLTDLPVAVLYVLAVTSVGVYGIVLAGWSSGSTYPLLGALRSTAQVISYEIAMGLTFAAVFLAAGTLSTSGIIAAQGRFWYVLLLLPSFLIYLVSMVGETNRAPFDLPEAEGELVGGFHTEYSSLRFAMFMLAEYINMTTVSALAVTMFLGGWQAPWPLSLWEGANAGWWPLLWFVVKVWLLLFVFIWLRSTLPRFRYDQFMNLGWKVLIPSALLWVMLVAVYRALRDDGRDAAAVTLIVCGIALAIAVAVGVRRHYAAERAVVRRGGARGTRPDAVPAPFDPLAGGFPVPPLPGQGGAPALPDPTAGASAAGREEA